LSASADSRSPGGEIPQTAAPQLHQPAAVCEQASIPAIVAHLESDPAQCWHALEGLTQLEPEVRLSIIEALSQHAGRPGAATLLYLLSRVRDRATRAAARVALRSAGAKTAGQTRTSTRASLAPSGEVVEALSREAPPGDERSGIAEAVPERIGRRVVACLVTPVNGRGLGSIVISAEHLSQRRTAAFLCDVRKGIRGVVGEVEPESRRSPGLIEELRHEWGGASVCDVPELALGLLAGTLMLSGESLPMAVEEWLDGTLGPGFVPVAFPASVPGLEAASIPDHELPSRVHALLDACPSWLDTSPLTFELADEICLREARPAVDQKRDAGAYRFLFEHRLIHRLEMYRRMILWMAWLWRFSGERELAQTALALARQLSDEQYVVPSHPFTLVLTTRSIEAAQARIRTEADPRNWRDRS
jgi:hypothetical protein